MEKDTIIEDTDVISATTKTSSDDTNVSGNNSTSIKEKFSHVLTILKMIIINVLILIQYLNLYRKICPMLTNVLQ